MGKWCAHCVGSFVLWTVWLLLAVLLAVQAVIALSHELKVPTRVVRSFEHGMAHAGLRVSFDTASFDPSGHVLIENLKVLSESFDEPLVTAKSVYLQIDPWALLAGSLEARWVHGQGVTFRIPAMLSPSGRGDPVLEDVAVRLDFDQPELTIRQFAGHAGRLAVNLRGALILPRARGTSARTARESVSSAVAQYVRVARELALAQARLEGVEEPSLELVLKPDERLLARVESRFSARSAKLTRDTLSLPKFDQKIEVDALAVEANFPLRVAPQAPVEVRARARAVHTAEGYAAVDVATRLTGTVQASPFAFVPTELVASAGAVDARGYAVQAVSLEARPKSWPRLAVQGSVLFAGDPWGFTAEGTPGERSALVSAEGRISRDLLSTVGRKLDRDLLALVAPEQPIRLSARARLDPGWKLGEASGRVEVGKVVAHGVALDQAGAHLHLAGRDLRVTDVILEQGQNLALGSYTMDTETLDYRFLLTGRLRPVGISGWFHDWWTHFWGNFDFAAAAPVADVDIQGRWREPHLSTVFVHVDCDAPIIRGVPLDRVRTTLFIRPDFYDALEVFATRGDGSARGWFTRSVDMNQHGFRWMEFQVASTLELQESARLFGREGTELVEPFRFEKPPLLKLSGRLEGEASEKGEHEDVSIDVTSTGGFWFFDFPLSNLTCRARVKDHDIDLPELRVNFANGSAHGRALVTGIGDDRKLSFDATVVDAGLGESIRLLEDFAARRRGEKPPPVSRFQQRVASGKLTLHAAATGLYRSAHSYVGQGTADLKGGELAEVNLLGALSEALRGNSLLGFTSWKLDTAHARFNIDREQLVFPELTITGPTAKLDAKGTYGLSSKSMNFNANFYPFEKGKTLLASAVDLVLTPVSAVLQLRLTGSLDKPKWFFTYGPTSLLRKLSGADAKPIATPPEPPPAPSPLLRR